MEIRPHQIEKANELLFVLKTYKCAYLIGEDLTPYDEFGEQLFDDWDEKKFNAFDNYMVHCLQLYLSKGLIKQNAKNLDMRKFIAETAMEFNEWISDNEHFPINKRNNKVEMFEGFILEYPDFKKWLTRKRFNIWVQKYASFKNFAFEQGNTNGIRWFQITDITREIEVVDDIDF